MTGSVGTSYLTGLPANSSILSMKSFAPYTYFSVHTPTPPIDFRYDYFYRLDKTSALTFTNYPESSNALHAHDMIRHNDLICGIDVGGRVWQFSTVLKFYVSVADFEGMTITEAYNAILQAYNLVGNISSTKTAHVYQRGNEKGEPITTGNTLSLSQNEIASIQQIPLSYSSVAWLEVTNGKTTYSFNGNAYNKKVLATVRKLELSNDFIPDEIVQSLCYNAFRFFNIDRSMYTIVLKCIPFFQYETLDNCNFSINTGHINISVLGDTFPIYATTFARDGNMTLEVLV
jgi:hypothetical protein